jgi:hypothetical protein
MLNIKSISGDSGNNNKQVKFTLEQVKKVQRGRTGIALLFP